MEIEFNRRTLILIIAITTLLLATVFLLIRMRPNSAPATRHHALTPTRPSSSQKAAAGNSHIDFVNQSAWQVTGVDACLPKLEAWLGNRYPLQKLTVAITDTVRDGMTLAVQQSGDDGASDAIVRGKCEAAKEKAVICTLAVAQGRPGRNLDVAATVAIAWLVEDFYRPKTKTAWRQPNQGGLEAFQPLISKENGSWQSDCLHLVR